MRDANTKTVIALVSPETLAERWDATAATVRRWARQNKVPAIKLPSGVIRFRVDDVNRVVEEGRI
jgi:predicted site-specific integrase-resolvase